MKKRIPDHSPRALLAESVKFLEFLKNRTAPFESEDFRRIKEESHADVHIGNFTFECYLVETLTLEKPIAPFRR
jgi:hypothetical protein